MDKTDKIHFYFSFRSPYAWLGFYRLNKFQEQLSNSITIDIEYVPIYPPKDLDIDKKQNIRKMAYISSDITRFANAYGFGIIWPKSFDTEWAIPHAAFLYAEELDKGIDYGLAAYSARFTEGFDIATDEVLTKIAQQCDLNANELIAAAHDRAYQTRVNEKIANSRKDKVFGVPFFIYKDQKYWGNDRLEWLIRDIYQEQGREIPDLTPDPLARPF